MASQPRLFPVAGMGRAASSSGRVTGSGSSGVAAGQSRLFPTTMQKTPVRSMGYQGVQPGGIVITKGSADAIEDFIMWAQNVSKKKLNLADQFLARYLAMVSGSFAQKYSAGMKRAPEDTTRSWAFPVPRVTGRYAASWRIQKVGRATWILTNDSREAYFIEYGIHRNPWTGQVSPRRIRRPVFKKAFLETLRWIHTTNLAHRVWADALIPRPGEPGRRTRQFTWYSQPSGVLADQPRFIAQRGVTMFEKTHLQKVRIPRRLDRGRVRGTPRTSFNVIHPR